MKIWKKLLILSWLICSFPSLAIQLGSRTKPTYAVIIDAGSTGSRVFIYRYRQVKKKALPRIELMASIEKGKNAPWLMRIMPGVSSFSQNLPGLEDNLKPLLQYVKNKLGNDPNVIKKTLVLMQATGGVRSLDLVEQKKLMQEVQNILLQAGFENSRAQVISGSIEGAYQWLAVNYLEGNLEKSVPTKGIIEMGGASMQVTFLPKKPPKKYGFPLKIGRHSYFLYSYSYDGFGESSAVAKWQNPDCQENGNFLKCKASIAKYLSQKKCGFAGECGLDGAYQTPIEGRFWAIDNFYDIGTLTKKPYFSTHGVEEMGQKICGKKMSDLEKLYPKREKRDLEIDCFDLAYFSLVLSGDGPHFKGIGFHNKTEQIKPANQIGKTAISWTLGSLLYQIITKPLAVYVELP